MTENRACFETILDRRGTNCARWDTMDEKYQKADMIHLGVADMDFQSPLPIRERFKEIIEHGIFGYSDLDEGFYKGIRRWMDRQCQLDVPKEWIVFCPRINVASSISVEALTDKEHEVMIHTPAYDPLHQAIIKNERIVVESQLVRTEKGYKIDFEALEQKVTDKTQMLIVCSPHNPVGRVWTKEELEQIGEFCVEHNLVLFVDEIHSDILAKGHKFTSALSLSSEVLERLVIATSLTKTFNIPGVIISYMIIPNLKLREKIQNHIDRVGMHNPNIFAATAVEVAYTKCDDWYEEMLQYIDENEVFTRAYFKAHMPEFTILPREGTYLLWMDYKDLGCSGEALEKWFLEEANVSVYMGTNFGEEGKGYIRMNIASPKALLEEAYERMTKVYHNLLNK